MTGGGKTTKARTNAVLQGNYRLQGNDRFATELRLPIDRITSLGGIYRWEEITGCRKIPENGEMHEWEEITEPAKVQGWERFPSAGKLQSAAKLQLRGEIAKVHKTTKSSWSICGTIDPRPSIESRRDLVGREPGRTHGGSGPRGSDAHLEFRGLSADQNACIVVPGLGELQLPPFALNETHTARSSVHDLAAEPKNRSRTRVIRQNHDLAARPQSRPDQDLGTQPRISHRPSHP